MGKAKRLRKSKQQQDLFEVYLKELETKRQNNVLAFECIKGCIDDNILPLIVDAMTIKEAWISLR